MGMWGNTDVAGNSAIYAVAQVHKAPTAANRNALYGNTTANGYGTSETVGQYGVDKAEMQAKRADGLPKPAAAGWVLKTTGQDGRAGRVKYETLVAMHVATEGGGGEDVSFPDYSIQISVQPTDKTGDVSNNDIVKFSTNAYNIPSGGSITYLWQKYGGATFANLTNGGAYSNVSTKELSVLANVEANGAVYRCGVYQSGATTKYTGNAVITIVP